MSNTWLFCTVRQMTCILQKAKQFLILDLFQTKSDVKLTRKYLAMSKPAKHSSFV